MRLSLGNGLIAGGFVVLTAVAVAGWMRHATPAPAAVTAAQVYPQSTVPQTAYQYTEDANTGGTGSGAAVSAPDVNPPTQGDISAAQGYVNNDCATSPPQAAVNGDPYLIPSGAPVVVRPVAVQYAAAPQEEAPPPDRRASRYYRRRHHRSWQKSLAIVGGTAGVGAAIGAIAGGGRGAALGALSGGGAGFLYDRLTHNR